jgi:hypothetical protein
MVNGEYETQQEALAIITEVIPFDLLVQLIAVFVSHQKGHYELPLTGWRWFQFDVIHRQWPIIHVKSFYDVGHTACVVALQFR